MNLNARLRFAASILIAITSIGLAQPASSAPLPCQSMWDFVAPGNCVVSAVSGSIAPANADTCTDDWGYKGYDYLSYVAFDNVSNSGRITRGKDIQFTARMRQECISWKDAYRIEVSIISSTGRVFTGLNSASTFTYDEDFSNAALSYCSTEICGDSEVSGTIPFPKEAPLGIYKIRVGLIGTNQFNKVSKRFSMATSLTAAGTALQVDANLDDQAPLVDGMQFVDTDGVLNCFITDYTSTAISTYSITGTDFLILEDDIQIDSITNWPIASSDDVVVTETTHGYFVKALNAAAKTRIYSYTPKNQKKGSKYECLIGVHTSRGSGAAVSKSLISAVSTIGITVPEGSSPPKSVKVNIKCAKGKAVKKVSAVKPTCPKGYKKIN